jgi:hypothetical protein
MSIEAGSRLAALASGARRDFARPSAAIFRCQHGARSPES